MFVTPNIPMLFMGEEYGERNPFYYFVSHLDPNLNLLVKEGRKKEFEEFYTDLEDIPDPASPDTFEKSKLSWNIGNNREHLVMSNWYRNLIDLRKNNPVLKIPDKKNLRINEYGKGFILLRWQESFQVLALLNFHKHEITIQIPDEIKGTLEKVIDSSEKKWEGPGSISPAKTTAGEEVKLPQESIVIYSSILKLTDFEW